MPKADTDYPVTIGVRIPASLKIDLLDIHKAYSVPAREAIEQYLPIKRLMLQPLGLPRIIESNDSKIEFSVSQDGMFQLTVNDKITVLSRENIKILMANIFLFTLNTIEV